MEPIYNFNDFGFGNTPISTTSAKTTSFDWGSLLNSGANGEIEGGLAMAANAIVPGSSMVLAPILEELNLNENYQLAKKYGWNSWGASASPESISAEFESITMPEVVRLMQNVSTDPQKALSDTRVYLESIIALRQYLKQYHSKANSTKQANELMVQKCQNLLRDVVQSAVSKLKSIGCVVSDVTYTGNPTFNYAYSHWGNTTLSNAMNDRAVSSFKPKGYKITASAALKQKIKDLQMQPTQSQNPEQNFDFVTDFTGVENANNNPNPKSSDSTIYIVAAAMVLLFWKNIKKLLK